MRAAPDEKTTVDCNIVIALKCEAKPLINHYGLQRDNSQSSWPVYHNNGLTLIISGAGKANATAACAWLQAQQPAHHWLNIGIAGHARADIGSQWLVETVTDATTQEYWRIDTALLPDQSRLPLITVDNPSEYERDNCLYDMEAAGLMSVCNRIPEPPSITVLKIVSDNNNQHWKSVNSKTVSALITAAMPLIQTTIDALLKQCHAPTS